MWILNDGSQVFGSRCLARRNSCRSLQSGSGVELWSAPECDGDQKFSRISRLLSVIRGELLKECCTDVEVDLKGCVVCVEWQVWRSFQWVETTSDKCPSSSGTRSRCDVYYVHGCLSKWIKLCADAGRECDSICFPPIETSWVELSDSWSWISSHDLCFKDLALLSIRCKVRGIRRASKPLVLVYSEGFESEAAKMGRVHGGLRLYSSVSSEQDQYSGRCFEQEESWINGVSCSRLLEELCCYRRLQFGVLWRSIQSLCL